MNRSGRFRRGSGDDGLVWLEGFLVDHVLFEQVCLSIWDWCVIAGRGFNFLARTYLNVESVVNKNYLTRFYGICILHFIVYG